MFSRPHNALKKIDGWRVTLTAQVHYELSLWRYFIDLLGQQPTHLQEIWPYPPSKKGATYASLEGIR